MLFRLRSGYRAFCLDLLSGSQTDVTDLGAGEGDLRELYIDAWRSVVRTVLGTATSVGRSRVTDVGYYWLAAAAVRLLLRFATGPLAWDAKWFADGVIGVVLVLPAYALFARRLHDQGLSAWWTLILLPPVPINLYQSYRAVFAVRNARWLHEPNPLDVLFPWALVAGLVIVVLFLRPGTRGLNRYGPDPRDSGAT